MTHDDHGDHRTTERGPRPNHSRRRALDRLRGGTTVTGLGGPVRPSVVALTVLLLLGAPVAAMGASVVAGSESPADQQSPVERWSRTYGGAADDDIVAVARREGGYLLAGNTWPDSVFESDAWLVKVDEDGVEQWNRTYHTDRTERVHAMVPTPDDGALLVGSAGDFGPASDGWVLHVDANGTERWNRTYGGPGAGILYDVLQTSDGDYVLAGETGQDTEAFADAWLVRIDEDGVEQWNRTYGGVRYDAANSLVRTEPGYAFAGYTGRADEPQVYRWLVAVDESGVEKWNRTYEPVESSALPLFAPLSLVRTADGFVLGGTEITTDGGFALNTWVMHVDEDGTPQWTRTTAVVGDDFLTSMAVTPDGGVVVAGEGGDPSQPVPEQHVDAWVMQLTADGQTQWTRTFGDNGEDGFLTVHRVDGGYLLGGYTTSFGAGRYDGYLVRLDGDANVSVEPSSQSPVGPHVSHPHRSR